MAGYDGSIRIDTKIDGKGFNNGINTISNSLRKFVSLIGTAFSLTQIYKFSKECVNEASKMQSALVGLQSIVEGQGRSFEKAKSFINSYTNDGLIPATDAITAYKNLAARGYNDEQIQKTMLALKDAAAFGRQSAYTYGEAIASATEGLKNENSVLVDNAGVTKNVAKMWEDYAKSIGTTTNKLTTQQKIQAEVNGILEETKFQTGDAIKYAQIYEGQTARLSASFIKLKQNIGSLLQGMFGQVIIWVGKAIEGINIFIQAIGQVIAMFTGKNPLESFSNGIQDTSDAIKNTSSGIAGIGSEADESSKKVKDLDKQLAGFDRVNKLSSNKDNTGAGTSRGGVSGGTTSGNIGDLGINNSLTDRASAKIKKLANQIKSFLDTTMKTIKKFEPALKGIGAGFLAAFGFKWISGAVKKFLAIKGITGIITAIKKALITATTVFKLTGNPLKALAAGFSSVANSLMSFLKNLSPMQKFQVSLVVLVATFVTTYNAVKQFTKGNMDLGTALLNIVPIATAVGVAMYGMLGPVGLVIEAIALITAGVLAYNQAQKELEEEKALERLFDGQGIALDIIVDKFKEYNEETIRVGERVGELSDNIEENTQAFRDGAEDVDYFLSKMNVTSGKISDEDIPKLNNAFENLSSSTKDSINNTVSILQNTLQSGMTKVAEKVGVDADKIIDKYIEIQLAAGQEISKLDIEYKKIINNIEKRGYATEDEQKQIRELVQEYAKFNPEISETKSIYDDLITQNFNKVNLGDPTKLKENVETLKNYKNDLINEANSTYQTSLNEIDKMIALAENLGFSDEYIEKMKRDKETLGKSLSLNIKDIESQYGGTLGTVLAQIVAAGAEGTKDLEEVVNTINEELGKTGKNVNIDGEENKLFTRYFATLQEDNNANFPKLVAMLSQLGIDMRGNFMQSATFTDAEKMILSNNFYEASQLSAEDKQKIAEDIKTNGIEIKNATGESVTFTEGEKDVIAKMLTEPYYVAWGKEKEDVLSVVEKIGPDTITAIINSTYKKIPDLKKTGSDIPIKLKDGINEKSSLPVQKVEEIIDKLQTTSENKELIRKYLEAGYNIDEGLAKGLQEKMGIPEKQAQQLGNEIINATRQALDSHSPSRKFISIGEDADQGLANGLRNKKSVVINEAKNIANDLVNMFKKLKINITFPDIRKSANSLISRFQTMLNNITSGMNDWLWMTTRSLNSLYVTGDGKVGYSGISRVSIPRLAKGGIAYRPTYAQIGEAGKEAVLPLENNTGWMDMLADKLSERIGFRQSSDGNIIIYVTVDGEIIQKVVKDKQKQENFATNGGI